MLQLDKKTSAGAIHHASFIDPKLVARYRKMFEPFIRPIKGSVTLSDAKTTHSVSEVVTLKLSFVDDDLQEHRGIVELVVFESGSHIVIGLPDIARIFGALFIKMIQKAITEFGIIRDIFLCGIRDIMLDIEKYEFLVLGIISLIPKKFLLLPGIFIQIGVD